MKSRGGDGRVLIMDHTTSSPLYAPRGFTFLGGGTRCLDLHRIADAEWEHNHDTGGSRLRVLDSEPATCMFATWSPLDIQDLLTERAGKCEEKFDTIPF